MDRGERYEREKQQGIRDESGAIIGGLDLIDFANGYDDAKRGVPSPDEPSLSYEIGRTRWEEDDAFTRNVLDSIARREAENQARFRASLADRPDILARYDAVRNQNPLKK